MAGRKPAADDRSDRLEREWQQTYDAVTEIVAQVSPGFKLLRLNRAGCESLGMKAEEAVGKRCFDVVHGTKCPIDDCPCRQALESKQPGVGEFSQDGRHYIATATPIFDSDGEVVALTHTVKDITGRRRAEKELVRLQQQVADLVQEQMHRLSRTEDEAARQTELMALERMTASLAREMQATLENIRSAAGELSRDLPGRTPGRFRPEIGKIETEADRAELALSAAVDYVRHADPDRAGHSVSTILNRAIKQARIPAEVAVNTELAKGLPRVFVDGRRMVVVFANLLNNAARAMPKGGVIDVFAARQDESVTVAVSDSGTGIAPDLTDRLFEPVFSTRAPGSGLGLAVAKAFVEEEGGSIRLRTEPGKGTTFLVTLPVA